MVGKFVFVQDLATPVPGDLIEFHRGDYKHWAMYSDKPGFIFNVDAESKNDTEAPITLVRLTDVAGSSKIRVNNLEKLARIKGLSPRNGCDAVEAARSVLDTKAPYNFIGMNCEYYVTKWRYGNGFSDQVKQNRSKAVYLGCTASGLGIGATVGSVVPVAGTFAGAMVGSFVGQVIGLGWLAYDVLSSGT